MNNMNLEVPGLSNCQCHVEVHFDVIHTVAAFGMWDSSTGIYWYSPTVD